MTAIDLKCLLLRRRMSITQLARQLHCSRYSVTESLRKPATRPRVYRRLADWYERNQSRVA